MAVPNSRLRRKPLTGPKMVYYAPLPASKRMASAAGGTDDDKNFCRILCKDAIGSFLGLPRAPHRVSTFKDKEPAGDANNVGKRFQINEKIGANPYILTLLPGTKIAMGEYDWEKDAPATIPTPEANGVYMKKIEIYVPSHIQVWRMLYWLENATNEYIADGGGTRVLTQYTEAKRANLKKIISITTPTQRTYNILSIMSPVAVPSTGVPQGGPNIP